MAPAPALAACAHPSRCYCSAGMTPTQPCSQQLGAVAVHPSPPSAPSVLWQHISTQMASREPAVAAGSNTTATVAPRRAQCAQLMQGAQVRTAQPPKTASQHSSRRLHHTRLTTRQQPSHRHLHDTWRAAPSHCTRGRQQPRPAARMTGSTHSLQPGAGKLPLTACRNW